MPATMENKLDTSMETKSYIKLNPLHPMIGKSLKKVEKKCIKLNLLPTPADHEKLTNRKFFCGQYVQ